MAYIFLQHDFSSVLDCHFHQRFDSTLRPLAHHQAMQAADEENNRSTNQASMATNVYNSLIKRIDHFASLSVSLMAHLLLCIHSNITVYSVQKKWSTPDNLKVLSQYIMRQQQYADIKVSGVPLTFG